MMERDAMPDPVQLPAPRVRRFETIGEDILYVARPGLRAVPSGSLAVATFAGLQAWTLTILLWAIWWPAPRSRSDYGFSIGATSLLALLVIGVIWLLLRRNPGFVMGVLRAPFIRLTVTDRRVLWSLPWAKPPLMEIGRDRILGGILGQVDHRGNGSAAIMLVPGDPAADIDGNIHFDRLPDAWHFVAAFRPR